MKNSKPLAWSFSVKSVLLDGINPSSMDEIPYRDEIRLRREIRTDLISSKPPAWISSASADFILATARISFQKGSVTAGDQLSQSLFLYKIPIQFNKRSLLCAF